MLIHLEVVIRVKLGTWGDIGCFSFEEKKIIATGDGGMICSNKSKYLKFIKARRWVEWIRIIGNYQKNISMLIMMLNIGFIMYQQ